MNKEAAKTTTFVMLTFIIFISLAFGLVFIASLVSKVLAIVVVGIYLLLAIWFGIYHLLSNGG